LSASGGSRVGPRIVLFEAYSAFTRVTACTLALSPYFVTCITEGFNYFATSIVAPVAPGWSICRVGLSPTEVAPPFNGARQKQWDGRPHPKRHQRAKVEIRHPKLPSGLQALAKPIFTQARLPCGLTSAAARGAIRMALTSLELGKLKIVAHVREELDRAGIAAQSIRFSSGGIHTPPGIARLTIVVNETAATLDFKGNEVEDCEFIVAGETWHKIAAFINRLAR
jgi:hypothetical protein